MKTLKESILTNMEDTLEKGISDADRVYFNIDTLPTINDFEKAFFNNKWHEATWYCPNVLDRYKSKYQIVPKDADSISVVIDASFGRVCDVNLYFTTGKGTNGVTVRKKSVRGWNDGLVGSNLRNYKKMAISLLTQLANHPEKLEEIISYSNKYAQALDQHDPAEEEFYRVAAKWPIKQLFNLINN